MTQKIIEKIKKRIVMFLTITLTILFVLFVTINIGNETEQQQSFPICSTLTSPNQTSYYYHYVDINPPNTNSLNQPIGPAYSNPVNHYIDPVQNRPLKPYIMIPLY